ncbi:MAG: T9SS type A sorting domain-containing protein [Ignavibacteria bacterium]|jgi:hypothetical protein
MKIKYILISSFLFFTFLYGIVIAQTFQNVMIDNVGAPEEPSISINPKNISQLVAGANIDLYYWSSNGGFNWTKGTLVDNQNGVWGDPSMQVDTAGNFYFFHLANPPSPGNWIDRIVCAKSTNGGINYGNPGTYTGLNGTKAQDKAWTGVDWSHGPRGNWIYVTWTEFDSYGSSNTSDSSRILFSRSSNSGANWSTPVRISRLGGDCLDGDNTTEGAVPVVGPHGEIYVAWAGPKVINSQYGIFFDRSTDGGITWLPDDIYVTNQPGGWTYDIPGIYRCNGMPITCCDLSPGPYHGNIYINWSDEAGTGDHDVKFIRSTNGGFNWSSPVRVNDDAPGKEQFFTWMTVDQTSGYIYIVFYDRRNYTDNETDVYIARSTNAGASFYNFRISSSPFTPTSSVFFGDYNNITVSHGSVRPIWTRLQSGQLSIWTAILEEPLIVKSITSEIPKSYSLFQNYPNPFNPSTKIRFDIPESMGSPVQVKLLVYDILGRELSVLANEKLPPGTYEYEWNGADYSSGVYFYTLTTGDNSFSETRKMILSK